MKIIVRLADGEILSEHSVESSPVTLGRALSAGIVISDSMVSGIHAEVSWSNDQVSIRDLGSSNGTFVGQTRIQTQLLKIPAKFYLGTRILIEVCSDTRESTLVGSLLTPNLREEPTPVAIKLSTTPPRAIPQKVIQEKVIPQKVMQQGPGERISFWITLWEKLIEISGQKLILMSMLAGLIVSLIGWVILRPPPGALWSIALGSVIGVPFGSFIGAVFIALLGWAFRGEYRIWPLFAGMVLSSALYWLADSVVQPFVFIHGLGLIANGLMEVLKFGSSLAFGATFVLTVFPHRFAHRLCRLLITLLTLNFLNATIGSIGSTNQADQRQVYAKELFQKDLFGAAKIIAGAPLSTAQLAKVVQEEPL